MAQLIAYLTFNGNCREAMTFYQACLGGQLQLETVGESPTAEQLPQQMKDCILQATLSNGHLLLMATDMVSETGLTRGNAVSILINCHSRQEMRDCFLRLSAGGETTHPIAKTHWGAWLGGLTDKYGNPWLLTCQ